MKKKEVTMILLNINKSVTVVHGKRRDRNLYSSLHLLYMKVLYLNGCKRKNVQSFSKIHIYYKSNRYLKITMNRKINCVLKIQMYICMYIYTYTYIHDSIIYIHIYTIPLRCTNQTKNWSLKTKKRSNAS